jgi:hypothetical protein
MKDEERVILEWQMTGNTLATNFPTFDPSVT